MKEPKLVGGNCNSKGAAYINYACNHKAVCLLSQKTEGRVQITFVHLPCTELILYKPTIDYATYVHSNSDTVAFVPILECINYHNGPYRGELKVMQGNKKHTLNIHGALKHYCKQHHSYAVRS